MEIWKTPIPTQKMLLILSIQMILFRPLQYEEYGVWLQCLKRLKA